METSNRQTSLFTEGDATSLQGDSLASHTAQLESDLERKMTATSGLRCLERFERLAQPGLWARTFAALLIGMEGWYSMRCRLTWKLKGTKSNRFYFQLVPSTLPTEGIGFGLLPTPRVKGHGNSHQRIEDGKIDDLTTMAKMQMLPTPMVDDNPAKNTGKRNQDGLQKRAFLATGKTSQLSPLFCLEMMGFPVNWTLSPFQSGETNPSKQPETQ